MSEFFNLTSPDSASKFMISQLSVISDEIVDTEKSHGRIISRDYESSDNLPPYARSSMDGYSVRASDTYGASDSLPAYLEVIGEIPMGTLATIAIKSGESAVSHTGGMIAKNADAVVMLEQTEITENGLLEVYKPVSIGENIVPIGDDFLKGSDVVSKGQMVDAGIIGSLLTNGITNCNVYRKPVVGICSAGDELVDPSVNPQLGQVRDINLYTIAAACETLPVDIKLYPRQKDDFQQQFEVAKNSIDECDVLIFTSGSSVSSRDLTSKVVESLGEPGVLIHGLTVKPGKPTVLGLVSNKPIIGLPGNPVSALTIFDIVAKPIILGLAGLSNPFHRPIVSGNLVENVASLTGRTDYIRVKLVKKIDEVNVQPVLGMSNSISTILKSDGYIEIPPDVSGLYAGADVQVFLD